jgi:molybdopterin/thiamine biosynthesis adenylyltransferase/rhodanese-related sulfurtransferase
LGLVDFDNIEVSNLHRQVIHKEASEGSSKVESAKQVVQLLNSDVKVEAHCIKLNASNSLPLVKSYDVIVDASDNPATRYMLNDVCVLAGKPLVSGSAIGMEGQITVYNHDGGPCYRCVYPNQPTAGTAPRCADAGVLGPIPGLIGCMQALEAIKVAAGMGGALNGKLCTFDGEDSSFRTFKLKRSASCAVCGDSPTITLATFAASLYDGGCKSCEGADGKEGEEGDITAHTISCRKYHEYLTSTTTASTTSASATTASTTTASATTASATTASATSASATTASATTASATSASATQQQPGDESSDGGRGGSSTSSDSGAHGTQGGQVVLVEGGRKRQKMCTSSAAGHPPSPPHILLDVRAPVQFAICSLPHAVNVPLNDLPERMEEVRSLCGIARGAPNAGADGDTLPIYVICRRGLDSAIALRMLLASGLDSAMHIEGGLAEWSRTVDPALPAY